MSPANKPEPRKKVGCCALVAGLRCGHYLKRKPKLSEPQEVCRAACPDISCMMSLLEEELHYPGSHAWKEGSFERAQQNVKDFKASMLTLGGLRI